MWPLVQDLHRAEFTRYALTAAEQGLAAALATVAPGSRLRDGVWRWPAAPSAREAGEAGGIPEVRKAREIRLDGRGLVLLPTFHWRGGPLVQDLPDRPVVLTYPVGGGVPPTPESRGSQDSRGPGGEAGGLTAALGRTRTAVLQALTEPRTTTDLARRTGVSNATASAHAAALRAAGLITTTRTGRSVHHERTPLGTLVMGTGHTP